MFDSLFGVKFNWLVLFVMSVGFFIAFPTMSFLSYIGLIIALHQLLLLFFSLNYVIPIRYLTGSLMTVQMLVGPVFAYNGINEIQYFKYRMQVPENEYYAYAIPACVLFILGLHILSRLRGEIVNVTNVQAFVKKNPNLMYWFIGVGFVASIFTSNIVTTFGFVFYLIAGFKYIGTFLVILGVKKLKIWPIVLVFGGILLSSLSSTMFHDLITWVVFLAAVMCIKFKPSIWIKTILATVFLIIIVVLQQVKQTVRSANAYQNVDNNAILDAVKSQNKSGELFDETALGRSTVRINQGFIVTHVMRHVPAREPYANGAELYRIFEAAILPRFLAPNKLNAGDNSLVYQYAGIRLNENTSMSLSALGDGYANFGLVGGSLFMFGLGLLFNLVLIGFYKKSLKIPIIIIFLPLVFYYPIRPDTALQTSLGHLFKTSFVLFVVMKVWERRLTFYNRTKLPEQPLDEE